MSSGALDDVRDNNRWEVFVVSRRIFLVSSSMTALAGLVRLPAFGQAPAAAPPATFKDLRSGVGLFTARGGTIGWFVSPEALAVVDTQFPDTAAQCLAGLKERSPRGIDVLLNTHHHGDHTAGNGVFRPAAKIIVAHQHVPALQRAAAERAKAVETQTYADTTFDTDWKQALGRETITARHYGPAHTGGDAIVVFERANVVHMGDLVFNRLYPFIDRPAGASISGWIGLLDKVAGQHDTDTLYIFGHGRDGFGVTGSREDLHLQRDYLSALLDTVRKAVAAGRSKEEISNIASIPGFGDHAEMGNILRLSANLGVAYDELTDAPR
jgi:cyclase